MFFDHGPYRLLVTFIIASIFWFIIFYFVFRQSVSSEFRAAEKAKNTKSVKSIVANVRSAIVKSRAKAHDDPKAALEYLKRSIKFQLGEAAYIFLGDSKYIGIITLLKLQFPTGSRRITVKQYKVCDVANCRRPGIYLGADSLTVTGISPVSAPLVLQISDGFHYTHAIPVGPTPPGLVATVELTTRLRKFNSNVSFLCTCGLSNKCIDGDCVEVHQNCISYAVDDCLDPCEAAQYLNECCERELTPDEQAKYANRIIDSISSVWIAADVEFLLLEAQKTLASATIEK